MKFVQAVVVPENALLQEYIQRGEYTDAFCVETSGCIDLATYITAFYSSPVMRLERAILTLIGKPSTAAEVAQLAAGEISQFAAWNVAKRQENQILLPDFQNRTCSWLMVSHPNNSTTQLYFGSGVHRMRKNGEGPASLSRAFRASLRFHLAYSRCLLWAARRQLER